MRPFTTITAATAVFATVYASAWSCPGISPPLHGFGLRRGWNATKVADEHAKPRDLVVDPKGRLLVVHRGLGVVQYDTDTNTGCVTQKRVLIPSNVLNHGIALGPAPDATIQGNNFTPLYVSSATTVWSIPYDVKNGEVHGGGELSDGHAVIKGMSPSGHKTRTLAVAPHRPNLLVVSVGSDGNLDEASIDPHVGRSIVKVFDMLKLPKHGFHYANDGWNAGYGLRNEVGLAFDVQNMLWGVENSADEFVRTVNGTSWDVHNNNPAEELNYLGDVAKPNDNWYGYPSCFTVWDGYDFDFDDEDRDADLYTGDQFVLAPNDTVNDTYCRDRSVPPSLVLPPHTAPLGMTFDWNGRSRYVALHGSWNRDPPSGYKLISVPFWVRSPANSARGTSSGGGGENKRRQEGSSPALRPRPVAEPFETEGFKDIFFALDEAQCSSESCARPVGVAFNKESGALYMTSDASGEIFMLQRWWFEEENEEIEDLVYEPLEEEDESEEDAED